MTISKTKIEVAPSTRGFAPVYHKGRVNECPGCHGSQWWVGRFSAQCAYCKTALPLHDAGTLGVYEAPRLVRCRPDHTIMPIPDMRPLGRRPLELVGA